MRKHHNSCDGTDNVLLLLMMQCRLLARAGGGFVAVKTVAVKTAALQIVALKTVAVKIIALKTVAVQTVAPDAVEFACRLATLCLPGRLMQCLSPQFLFMVQLPEL